VRDPIARLRHARLRHEDRGEMLLVMAGLTALLFWQLGRSPGPTADAAGQDAALAGATVLRHQSLTGGGLDVGAACAAATRSAAGDDAEVVTCGLDPAGLTVVTGWSPERAARDGQSFRTSVVTLVDGGAGCLAVATSWGEQLPPVCGAATGSAADSDTGNR
jgi:hypothetical protein